MISFLAVTGNQKPKIKTTGLIIGGNAIEKTTLSTNVIRILNFFKGFLKPSNVN